ASLDGEFYSFPEAAVWPRSHQEPHPPIWIAAMSPPTIEWAASQGYNVANWPFIRPMSVVKDVAETFHAAREAANGERGKQKLTVLRTGFLTQSADELEQRIDQALINHRINQRLH